MIRSPELDSVLELAPEWEQLLRNFQLEGGTVQATEFLNRVGARAIYMKALSLKEERPRFLELLQRSYFQPMLNKMLVSNQNLRRFLAQRHVAIEDQKCQAISFSADLAQKMVANLIKQLASSQDDGFKALLPAYAQRSVHNAVIDYIRQEASWEKHTLQDTFIDPQQDDPRSMVADDVAYTPENRVISGEQVSQLNELRRHLEAMLADSRVPDEPLAVVDCIFGLGLTRHSQVGEEMTMRECCEKLHLTGETMARRIARCQVLLDKGMDMVRQRIYNEMPGIAECWQRGLNVNLASRRELSQQLGLTEGEIERLIRGRQFTAVEQLVDQGIVKPVRLSELVKKGAVAAFVPVDLNAATNRDILDVLGVSKEISARIVSERPFKDLQELVAKKLVSRDELESLVKRGAVVRNKFADSKRFDLNRSTLDELQTLNVDESIAALIVKTRPFLTWSEVEEFLGPESPAWTILRQRFFLGLTSG